MTTAFVNFVLFPEQQIAASQVEHRHEMETFTQTHDLELRDKRHSTELQCQEMLILAEMGKYGVSVHSGCDGYRYGVSVGTVHNVRDLLHA